MTLWLVMLLIFASSGVYAELSIASVGVGGIPMSHGVCATGTSVSNDGRGAFIAPMEERMDSVENGFHASYLTAEGGTIELLAGFERALAQSPLGLYRRTTNVNLAANRDFTLFTAIVEFIKTGTTPPGSDVTMPVTLGTQLVVFDAKGYSRAVEVKSDKGSVSRLVEQKPGFTGKQDVVGASLVAQCGLRDVFRIQDRPQQGQAQFAGAD